MLGMALEPSSGSGCSAPLLQPPLSRCGLWELEGTLGTWALLVISGKVKGLTRYLDPSGLGVISFEDFHQGITAIRNGGSDGQLHGVPAAQDEGLPVCPDDFDDFITCEASALGRPGGQAARTPRSAARLRGALPARLLSGAVLGVCGPGGS
ncbi:Rab11 family-interacting protein 3 [Tupaia chinensis]|uniref:Rab11 family-interacting protein 3 n=1 Tax=Tupaia chinensis TaxID=246437 RepID=L9KY78_TUPCH|nr:Rab11 family-interacting protein 3 [Tupaia chinensis]